MQHAGAAWLSQRKFTSGWTRSRSTTVPFLTQGVRGFGYNYWTTCKVSNQRKKCRPPFGGQQMVLKIRRSLNLWTIKWRLFKRRRFSCNWAKTLSHAEQSFAANGMSTHISWWRWGPASTASFASSTAFTLLVTILIYGCLYFLGVFFSVPGFQAFLIWCLRSPT